jgi:hypothetical protein
VPTAPEAADRPSRRELHPAPLQFIANAWARPGCLPKLRRPLKPLEIDMQKTLRSPCRLAAAFLALAIAAPFAAAQPAADTPPPGPRLPVRAACPDIDQTLPDALYAAWHRLGSPAEIVVEFHLQGQRVFDVTALAGPARYYRAVRQAVGNLECDGRDARVHDVRFRVAFVNGPGAGRGEGGTAIVDVEDRVAAAR